MNKRLREFLSVRQQRRQLLSMDERIRHDLAISRVDAEPLAGKFQAPFAQKFQRGEKRDV